MEEGAYGAGKAGAPFDPQAFVQKPTVIVRAVCWLFSVIVMGCISNGGWRRTADGRDECVLNGERGACVSGSVAGALGCGGALVLLGGEAIMGRLSSVGTRRRVVGGELGAAAFLCFVHAVTFCWLTAAWGRTERPPPGAANNVQSAIAFCFFSIFAWGACAFFALQRYRAGAGATFASSFSAEGAPASAGYPGAEAQQVYSPPPFQRADDGAQPEYAPTY